MNKSNAVNRPRKITNHRGWQAFKPFALSLLIGLPLTAIQAQEKPVGITYSDLSWMDNNHMKQQRTVIDDIARLDLGAQLNGNLADLEVLQRIIYRGLIKKDERVKLQAMGIVLGDVFVHELGLKWTVFEDKYGRTKAACIAKTEHCLFPVTMLSRRMEVGLLPNVKEIYEENALGIKALLPKNPYDASSH